VVSKELIERLKYDQCSEGLQQDALSRIEALEAERASLATQVVAMREALESVVGSLLISHNGRAVRAISIREHAKAERALAIDTTQAEAILRERDAKVLEEAAREIEKHCAADEGESDLLRNMAADRRMGK
jgi:hypothetical protein